MFSSLLIYVSQCGGSVCHSCCWYIHISLAHSLPFSVPSQPLYMLAPIASPVRLNRFPYLLSASFTPPVCPSVCLSLFNCPVFACLPCLPTCLLTRHYLYITVSCFLVVFSHVLASSGHCLYFIMPSTLVFLHILCW